jgi:hypothetical protein
MNTDGLLPAIALVVGVIAIPIVSHFLRRYIWGEFLDSSWGERIFLLLIPLIATAIVSLPFVIIEAMAEQRIEDDRKRGWKI